MYNVGALSSTSHFIHTKEGRVLAALAPSLSPLFRYNKVENFDGLSGCRTSSPRRYFN